MTDVLPFVQNTVTGEHSCMVIKPLNNDEIEGNGSDDWGFFSPFYKGAYLDLKKLTPSD